ncbi:MAG: 30S ribosomal protein S20 [Chloroflexi bacterium]|nr:30S ribosomal protein S20 [Chloroflexota bacterium]
MAHTKSAIKRIRSSERKRQRNRTVRSATRTQIKRARQFIESGEVESATEATLQAVRLLDKAAEKGVIHRGNAARRKSRLMRALQQAQTQAEQPAKV